MTATHLDALIAAADLTDRADRLMLADALTDAGRGEEAGLLRGAAPVGLDDDGFVRPLSLYQVRMTCEDGGSDAVNVLALDDEDAAKKADAELREWLEGGDWGADGAEVTGDWTLSDAGREEIDNGSARVTIEPDHDALIRAAGGEADCDHDWTSEGEGGCDENPGVWSTGGTSFTFASHCRLCGLHRTERTCGSQRNPGDHDTVEYRQPGSWCAECQREECECGQDEE